MSPQQTQIHLQHLMAFRYLYPVAGASRSLSYSAVHYMPLFSRMFSTHLSQARTPMKSCLSSLIPHPCIWRHLINFRYPQFSKQRSHHFPLATLICPLSPERPYLCCNPYRNCLSSSLPSPAFISFETKFKQIHATRPMSPLLCSPSAFVDSYASAMYLAAVLIVRILKGPPPSRFLSTDVAHTFFQLFNQMRIQVLL